MTRKANPESSLDREVHGPIEAAYAVAQYLSADPAFWLERCAIAGISIELAPDGGFYEMFEHADPDESTFLLSWLKLTPGGHAAVDKLLHDRASA